MPKVSFVVRKRQRLCNDTDLNFDGDELDDENSEQNQNAPLLLVDSLSKSKELENRANSLALDGNFRPAITLWAQALEHTPDGHRGAVLHEQTAQAFLELGEYFMAIGEAEKAIGMDESWGDAWVTLARAQYNWGDPRMAITSFNKAVDTGMNADELEEEIIDAKDLMVKIAEGEGASMGDLISAARSRERRAAWSGEHAKYVNK